MCFRYTTKPDIITLLDRAQRILKPGMECCPTLCTGLFISTMDKSEILQILEDDYGTSNPLEIPDSDRAILYENLRSNIRLQNGNPEEYTRQLIIISEALEL